MHDKILDFLKRKQEYVSGEEISSHLKISRQALWKHIEILRGTGYDIIAVPHLGYKLVSVPDRLFPSEIQHGLKTRFTGKKIYYFDTIASTNDMAMQLGIKGTAEGTVVLSEAQNKGRGRMGREWSSPKYKGIYMSLCLKPSLLPGQLPILTLLCAVSICEAIREEAGLETKIKWPNDIIMHNKKIGGILTELNAEMDEVRFVVIGIGLNVNNDRKSLISGATSLKEEKGEAVSRISLLQKIFARIEANYLFFQANGPGAITDKWRHYNITLGRRIRVAFHRHYLEGEAADIDHDGALLIRKDSGLIQKVTAGDVVHCR
jgi:BirA family transcriptional regulator, biotin operon repressor / biotin---[acetyl-CoA-carboxylase] ligase